MPPTTTTNFKNILKYFRKMLRRELYYTLFNTLNIILINLSVFPLRNYTQREILKYIVLDLRTFVLKNRVSIFYYQLSQYYSEM